MLDVEGIVRPHFDELASQGFFGRVHFGVLPIRVPGEIDLGLGQHAL